MKRNAPMAARAASVGRGMTFGLALRARCGSVRDGLHFGRRGYDGVCRNGRGRVAEAYYRVSGAGAVNGGCGQLGDCAWM
eukprot:7242536-Prymnesium_polylepis.1